MTEYEGVVYQLTQTQMDMLTTAFKLFENGTVQMDRLGDLLRSVGQNPTNEEVASIKRELCVSVATAASNPNPPSSSPSSPQHHANTGAVGAASPPPSAGGVNPSSNEGGGGAKVLPNNSAVPAESVTELRLHDFLSVCESKWFKSDRMKEDYVMEAFRNFDTQGKGEVSIGKLRHILLGIGERLPAEEADAFIEWAEKLPGVQTGEGMLNYEIITKRLMERDPNIM
eukprot:GHVQ01034981.1.p1 GENE.GHVQ01034981.1~~GHVQ01034981.1.p1  ORF type:complete len:227 (+),score=60.72 GHVQ01034981.1:472-1152(+)